MEWAILLFALSIFVVLVVSNAAMTARIQRIERKLTALMAHHGVPPAQGPAVSDRVKELAADPKRKIEAIKVYREETGAGLAEAKDAIEAYQQQLRSRAADQPLA